MSPPPLSNVRLITILAASLLAGYAGDEAYNVWWQPDASQTAESARLVKPRPKEEVAKVALADRP